MKPIFLDLVPEQDPLLFPRKKKADGRIINTSKVVRGRTVVRNMADITSICVHQTACVYGPLDQPERRHRRALNVPAHILAFRDGVFAQSAPFSWFLYHGNGINPFSIGVELEGQYPGLLDDPFTPVREDEKTFWPGGSAKPTPLDAVTIATFKAAIRHAVVEGRKQGAPIRYVLAHRQANVRKPSDPGQGIWQAVVLPLLNELQLEPRPGMTWDDGKTIPKAWDPERGVGGY